MDVLLVNPPLLMSGRPSIPLNLMSLQAALAEVGVEAGLCDLQYRNATGQNTAGWSDLPALIEDAADHLLRDGPRILGFTSCSGNYAFTLEIARKCRERDPGVRIVLGGPQPTLTSRVTLSTFNFIDAIAIGEGERTVQELMPALLGGSPLDAVCGIAYRHGDELVETRPRPLIPDLDALPRVDLSKIIHQLYGDIHDFSLLPVEMGRGCPLHCSFCCVNRIWRRKHRLKSVERCVSEISAAARAFPDMELSFIHDSLTINRRRFLQLCDAIISSGLKVSWVMQSVIWRLDEELLTRARAAGCVGIFIGVESASERIQRLYGKPIPITQVFETTKLMLNLGIAPTLAFIVGHPEEKLDEMLLTLWTMLQLACLGVRVKNQRLSVLAPHTGAPVAEQYPDWELWDCSTVGQEATTLRGLVEQYPNIFTQGFIFRPRVDTAWVLRYLAGYGIFQNTFLKFPRTVSKLVDSGLIGFESLLRGYLRTITGPLGFIQTRGFAREGSSILLNAAHYDRFPTYLSRLLQRNVVSSGDIWDTYSQELSQFEREFGLYQISDLP